MLFRMGLGGQFSGSLGAVVASHNAGGAYLRNRSVPTNPNTGRQQAARAALGSAAAGWKSLTSTVRANWRNYAANTPRVNALGDTIHLSGFAWYVAVSSFLISVGQAAPAAAPTTPGLSSFGGPITLTASAATGLTYATSATTVDGFVLVQNSPSLSAGVASVKQPLTLFGFGVAGVPPYSQNTVVFPRYGVLIAGQRRLFQLTGIDAAGHMSNVIQQIVTVAA